MPIKVFSDYIQVVDNLTNPRFKLVDNPKDALIFWSSMDYYEVVKSQVKDMVDENTFYLNQFQFEAAFVAKNHLANLIRLTLPATDNVV